MYIPALLAASAAVLLLLIAESLRPNLKFLRIWQIISIAAIVLGGVVLIFPTYIPSQFVKSVLESCCLPVFVGFLIRELLKVSIGLYRYKEETELLLKGTSVSKKPVVPNHSGIASKKKKRKK